MFGLFGKSVKELAKEQQKAQLKQRMDDNAKLSTEIRNLVRIMAVIPKRYHNVEPKSVHKLDMVHYDNQDEIFAFCESRVDPSSCWRRSVSDPNQPNSCWDCERSQIVILCPYGDMRTVKRIHDKHHTLNLKAYGMEG